MDRFRMIFQYFQSNSESVMNGICGLLALASVKIYTSFDFNCPCLPEYNMAYGLGIMFIPPVVLLLCGFIVNRQCVVAIEEWKRPTGNRKKNMAIIRYICSSILQRAMIAPIVWILVTLLDGKCFVCAFSNSVDPDKFSGFANVTPAHVQLLLSKFPCKEDELIMNNTSRKAVSRYLRCWSQALGWSILLMLILIAFLARSLRPCFNQAAFLQTRYWSNYIDIEQKIFDETCCEHARDFAHKCILHFFESMQKEIKLRRFNAHREEEEGKEGEKDHLRGITNEEQMNELLQSWYYSKPRLDLSRTTQQQCLSTDRTSMHLVDTTTNRWHPQPRSTTTRQTDV
ncbi:PREDICTED: calcium homeostasis modulator protein 3 [Gekko japonicus]|uniref:Calcium homeostasis modulator protein 3 n=1 Tax=Gekko japonicus TaxID=146911 RepID=A0ABM1KPE6_GEKJA|nr:PREDICTED: calcium homeostasis modulator protein 3 [Gekko japonicus]